MAHFHRLTVPSFDLTWLSLSENDRVALIAGGGGSFKSGVKNQIQIARVHAGDKVAFLESYITDEDTKRRLCCGLACGRIGDFAVVVALLDSDCLVLALEINADGTIKFARKVDFQVDFATEESSVNCCVVTKSGLIVTGGQDNVGRVWKVDINSANNWKVHLAAELRGHVGPIMALSDHPDENWVCSASKDGTCKVWDVTYRGKVNLPTKKSADSGAESNTQSNEGSDSAGAKDKEAAGGGAKDKDNAADSSEGSRAPLIDVPCCVDGIAGSGSATSANNSMQCRGCSFSVCGEYMYSIQSGKRGATHLIKWRIEKSKDSGAKVVPFKVALVTGVPCTLLRMDLTGDYIAVGASDGQISVFHTEALSRVGSYACHDLPVTGMGFAPPALAQTLGMKTVLASCSADRKLSVIKVGGYSMVFKVSLIAVLLLLCVLLFLYSASLWVLLANNNLLRPL